MNLGSRGLVGKSLSLNTFPQKKKPVEEAQRAPKKNKEPQKKKGKKDKAASTSSRTVSQHKKASKQAGPSSTANKTFKSQETKG